MNKQLKALTTVGVMAMALVASAPSHAETFVGTFWTQSLATEMDRNKDGMVSRQEYMDYLGAQYDKMDAKKKGMLNKQEFTDKKMMEFTFPNVRADG